MRNNEAQRETRKKDKLEREIRQTKSDLDTKTGEIKQLQSHIERYTAEIAKMEKDLREQKVSGLVSKLFT